MGAAARQQRRRWRQRQHWRRRKPAPGHPEPPVTAAPAGFRRERGARAGALGCCAAWRRGRLRRSWRGMRPVPHACRGMPPRAVLPHLRAPTCPITCLLQDSAIYPRPGCHCEAGWCVQCQAPAAADAPVDAVVGTLASLAAGKIPLGPGLAPLDRFEPARRLVRDEPLLQGALAQVRQRGQLRRMSIAVLPSVGGMRAEGDA